MERKIANNESMMKNLKSEYNNITENHHILKKQYVFFYYKKDVKSNKFEEFNAENYNLKQENTDLKRKLSMTNNNSRNTTSNEKEPIFKAGDYSKLDKLTITNTETKTNDYFSIKKDDDEIKNDHSYFEEK